MKPTLSLRAQANSIPLPLGLPTLVKMAFDGGDLAPLWNVLVEQVLAADGDAAALMDLSTIAHLQGRPQERLGLQAEALRFSRIYRQPAGNDSVPPVRVLALMAPGDFMANIPLEFMLEGACATLDMLYIVPGEPLPEIPDHDVAIVAIAESDENQPVLAEVASFIGAWPRPVLNAPERIARLTRAGTWEMLRDAPGIVIPMNVRIAREDLLRVEGGESDIASLLDGATFPIIARPADSHAGKGLVKLDDAAAISAYLAEWPDSHFYIAPFVDYASDDGMFRKYRVALIGGKPYACHMAISQHWMIHYLNADMDKDVIKRAEEAHFMATFDENFAMRHADALAAIVERCGLDYLPLDCGETREGKLLVFESGTNMIVHSMDAPELFPYKKPQMEKVFGAFEAMLREAAQPQPFAQSDAA